MHLSNLLAVRFCFIWILLRSLLLQIVVDFTASWCPPCKFIAPIFADLAKKFTNVTFLKVDVDELKPVAAEWEVEAMPTFIFLKDGKLVDKIVGADKDGLPALVEKHSAYTA